MLNRSKVADYTAQQLLDTSTNRAELVTQVAAWLKDAKSTRQMNYLVQDIATKLAEANYVFVVITTARPLNDESRTTILTFLRQQYDDTTQFEIVERIDTSLIGGVLIDTPKGSLDASVKSKLIRMIKGVQ